MLHVWSDIVVAADQRQVTLFALLDMSTAFDCVDHDLLLQRLQLSFTATGTLLAWTRSFLSDRTYQLTYGGELSATHLLQYGVPQWNGMTCTYTCMRMIAKSTPVWLLVM